MARQLYRLTKQKARQLLARGMRLDGFVLVHPTSNERAIVTNGGVRWLSGHDAANLMAGRPLREEVRH